MPAAFTELEGTYDYSTGFFRTPEGSPDGNHTELPVCQMWYWLARMVGARKILETGTYRGYSTCLFAAAVRDNGGGTVTTVDPLAAPHLWDGSDLEKYVRWIQKPSQLALAELTGESFDILVIDSEHTYRQSSWELGNFEPLLSPGGLILMHDSLFHDGVACTAAQLYANPRFECVTFDTPRKYQTEAIREPVSMGLTVIRKKSNGPALKPITDLLGMAEHSPDGPVPVLRQEPVESFRSIRLR